MFELAVLLPVAVLAGLATAVSPCILPVLPLVLGGGAAGGRRRPLGIATGVVLGFCAITLAATALVNALGLPPGALRVAAAALIAASAVSLLVPAIDQRLSVALGRLIPSPIAARVSATLAAPPPPTALLPAGGSAEPWSRSRTLDSSDEEPAPSASSGRALSEAKGRMTNDERDSSLVLRPPSDGHADGAGSRATPGASSGYLGGVVIGLGAGLVWTPCAGPILAAITALAATQSLTVPAGLIAVAYGTGAAVPLMLVARSGRALAGGVRWLRPQARRVRASFAAVMLAMSVLVVTGRDAGIQSALAAAGPAGVGAWIDRVEQAPVVRRWLASLFDDTFYGRSPGPPRKSVPERLPAAPSEPQLSVIGPAPDFEGISAWFNTSHPLTIQSLRGKVVLVDFWTYSCINCLRTLPYLRAWHDTYKDAGLVVVGVHTPEFAFEAEPRNVQAAIARERITYPVALDAKYETWRAYRNRFWPSKYLIDAQGRMRFYHSGEGAYVETERAIRALLVEAGMMLPGEMARLPGEPFVSSTATPETYLGWQRLEQAQYASPQPIGKNKEQRYSAPATPPLHNLAFDGLWTIHEEYAAAGAGAQLALRFTANHVYLVMAPGGPQPAQVRVMLDGQPISRELSGADVRSGAVIVDEARLYHLVDLKGQHGTHTLRLAFEQGGTESYAFTFG